jgi:hypothetical protein
VLTDLGVPICMGIKVVLGIQLGRRCLRAPFTNGVFVAVDLTRSGAEAGFDDIGTRVEIRRYSLDQALIRQGFVARSLT